MKNRIRLLISCPDRPGIVATTSRFLFERGANLVDSQQHSEAEVSGLFFLRIEMDLPDAEQRIEELRRDFAPVAEAQRMTVRFELATKVKRMAVLVSKQDHCLVELLWQWKAGDLPAELALVASNHPDLADTVAPYGVPFHHIPVAKENKPEAEARLWNLLEKERVDLLVLARYMQVLSPDLVNRLPARIINIHHSFLPAFVGANPYAKAYERGVKLIGATAHYVTAELDAGPIIEQDIHRVGHRERVEDLKRIGRHVERSVLARAVGWHLRDRVIVHGNKTVVFYG